MATNKPTTPSSSGKNPTTPTGKPGQDSRQGQMNPGQGNAKPGAPTTKK